MWYSQLLDIRLFWLDSPNKVELQRVSTLQSSGMFFSKFQEFFNIFVCLLAFMENFYEYPFFKFEHCVIVKRIFKKPWSHFQLLIGKIRFEIPKPRQDPPSHFHNNNSILIYISPMTFLDYFMFNRDKSKLAMVSRIMSCRHVSIIGN